MLYTRGERDQAWAATLVDRRAAEAEIARLKKEQADEIARLREERAGWQSQAEEAQSQGGEQDDEIARMQERLASVQFFMQEALRTHGVHGIHCLTGSPAAFWRSEDADLCDCGLAAVLAPPEPKG